LSDCFVDLYPINVKSAEHIWPKFFVGSHVTPGKVYESKYKKLRLKIFIFVKFENAQKNIMKIRKLFYFWFQTVQIEDAHK